MIPPHCARWFTPLVFLLGACAELSSRSRPAEAPAPPGDYRGGEESEADYGRAEGGGLAKQESAPMGSASADRAAPMAPAVIALGAKSRADEADKLADGKKDEEKPAQTRSWFPESLLWMPLVETGPEGEVTIPVAVPDSLTTWRVLALAHNNSGSQAGATATFLSTLPAYVDVVVPGSLFAGDQVNLPVQVVNTTVAPIAEFLSVAISGATGAASGTLGVGGGGSATRSVALSANQPGIATIRADFGNVDSVERSIPVRPAGRMLEHRLAGSAAAAKPVSIPMVSGADLGELVVTAWPGALSVVRAEIEGPPVWITREPSWQPADALGTAAYRYALAIAGASLDQAEAHAEILRTMRISAWQPLARAGRAPDTETACLLAAALRGSPADSLEGRLAQRMAETVLDTQSADGTWLTAAADIDATLVETALCSMAVPGEPAAQLQAEGAFHRFRERLEDPALAAYVLASGAISDPELRDQLVDVVKMGLIEGENGTRFVEPKALRRGDGKAVSRAEATAAAALGLIDDTALAAELATSLLGMHQSWGGWSDGEGNLLVLRALTAALPNPDGPVPELVVSVDGTEVARGSIDPSQPHKPFVVRAPLSPSKTHEVVIAGGGPGISYSLAARAWVPWSRPERGVVEIAVDVPRQMVVGSRTFVPIRVASPSTIATNLIIGLPAGVRADADGMDALVLSGVFSSWTGAEGSIVVRGLPGGGWNGLLPVVASLSGSISAAPSRVVDAATGEELYLLPPSRWQIGT